jgi:hypothetical protein
VAESAGRSFIAETILLTFFKSVTPCCCFCRNYSLMQRKKTSRLNFYVSTVSFAGYSLLHQQREIVRRYYDAIFYSRQGEIIFNVLKGKV